MKRLIAIVIVVGVILGGIALNKKNTVEYIKSEPTVIEKTVEVETLQTRIKDAQQNKMSEIEASAQQAYQERKDQMLTEIELETTRAYRKEIEDREAQLEEKVSL